MSSRKSSLPPFALLAALKAYLKHMLVVADLEKQTAESSKMTTLLRVMQPRSSQKIVLSDDKEGCAATPALGHEGKKASASWNSGRSTRWSNGWRRSTGRWQGCMGRSIWCLPN